MCVCVLLMYILQCVYTTSTTDKIADHDVDVPPPKPPRRRSSVNRSRSLSIAPIKTASEQQENFYNTLR